MTESIVKTEKGGQVSGFIALLIATALASIALTLSWGVPTSVSIDPYAAYCRGYSDGVANVLMDEGQINQGAYEEGAPLLDAECILDVKLDNPTFTANLRGPLLPGEPE